jgi:hypothetical protein
MSRRWQEPSSLRRGGADIARAARTLRGFPHIAPGIYPIPVAGLWWLSWPRVNTASAGLNASPRGDSGLRNLAGPARSRAVAGTPARRERQFRHRRERTHRRGEAWLHAEIPIFRNGGVIVGGYVEQTGHHRSARACA